MTNGNGKRKTLDKSFTFKPTENFKAFVDAYLNPDLPNTITAAAQAAGISTQAVYDYVKKHPEAHDYIAACADEMAKVHQPKIMAAMIKKAERGDVAAARLCLEVWGLKVKVEHSGSAINVVIPQELERVGSN